MKYKLCASHLPNDLSFAEETQRRIALEAVGITVYGPIRTIDAASKSDAEELFLRIYSSDFNEIECYDGGYLHIREEQ